MGEVVADVAYDESVPENGGWLGNCVEQLAGEVEVALLAELAQSESDGFGLARWGLVGFLRCGAWLLLAAVRGRCGGGD